MRTKSVALLVLALGCGLVASLGITQVMARRGSDATPAGETQTVMVAVKDVALGETLSTQNVRSEEWPQGKVPTGALARLEDVDGRKGRAKFYQGEPILEQRLFGKGMDPVGADGLIPKGYRVVTVRVDAVSANGNLLLPGSRVDLLVHIARNPSIGFPETTTRTILQNIKVFAVNEVVSTDPAGGPESKSIAARTVSLLVTPNQAEKITLAAELGNIRLVMRSPEEDSQAQTHGALPQELFGDAGVGHRERETLLPVEAGSSPKATGGFLEFLKAQAKNMPSQGGVPTPNPETLKWSMRVLKGAQVDDVELEPGDQLTAAGGDVGLWKVNGLKSGPANKVEKSVEALPPVTVEPPKTGKAGFPPLKEVPMPVKDNGIPTDKHP
jgi:pilus assembly protein CpaB